MEQRELTEILKDIGIPSLLRGYDYLKSAIELMYSENDLKMQITKKLYPEVARMYNTTASRVERGIRYAIAVGFDNIPPYICRKIFGNSININRHKPTNSHFIVALVDYIKGVERNG